MKGMRRITVCASVVCLALAASQGWSQSSEGEAALVSPQVGEGADPVYAEAPSWGTSGYTILNMGAAAFTPRDTGSWGYFGTGYINCVSGSEDIWAPVLLPVGAYLDGMRVFYYDADGTYNVRAWFTRYYGDTGYQDIAGWTSTGSSGYGSSYVTIGHTIHYLDPNDGEQSYNVIFRSETTGTSLAVKGVRLLYLLQVSPAPATATYNDVPTGHPFYQYVEALAASGITAGCGSGNYCPDSPVTRGQMAVFLAKALGLHWYQ